MFVKSTRFKQVCQLLLSLIVGQWLKGVSPPGNWSRAPDKQTFEFVPRLFIYLPIYQLFIIYSFVFQ